MKILLSNPVLLIMLPVLALGLFMMLEFTSQNKISLGIRSIERDEGVLILGIVFVSFLTLTLVF